MTTSSDMMGDIEKAFEVGAEEYLVKPFDKEKLLKMIHKHIG
jgi:CheY-like chemotaxis protein